MRIVIESERNHYYSPTVSYRDFYIGFFPSFTQVLDETEVRPFVAIF